MAQTITYFRISTPDDLALRNLILQRRYAPHIRTYGVRLMPELYEHLNPMPFEAAVQMEVELAEDLRAAGYTVTGGH
jgi:hypothetical protein